MKLNSKYTYLWIVWLAMFGAVEWSAIKNKKSGDTLSEHIWKLIGTKGKARTALNWGARLGLGLLLAWLIPHFFTGWNF